MGLVSPSQPQLRRCSRGGLRNRPRAPTRRGRTLCSASTGATTTLHRLSPHIIVMRSPGPHLLLALTGMTSLHFRPPTKPPHRVTASPRHLLFQEKAVHWDTADEELQVCNKCCAQFEDQGELANHKDCCPVNNPVVVIVANQEDGSPVTHERVKPPESAVTYRALDNQCSSLIVGTPEMQVPRVGATPANSDCKSSGVAGFHGMGTSRSYWSDMRSKEGGTSQQFLAPGGSLNQEDGPSPKIGQGPHDAALGGSTTGTPLNIPMILEELRVLQQRQIHQMQMTEQICRQVLMLGSLTQPAMPLAASSGPSPTSPGTGSKSTPAFSTIKMNPVPEVAKAVPVAEVPAKQAYFQLYNPLGNPFIERNLPGMKPKTQPHFDEKPTHGTASMPTSPHGQLLPAHAAFPAGILGPQVGMFLGTRVVEPVPSLLKQKNGEPTYTDALQEKSSGRHKCRFCAKVFGSDSALQIHLRSHTGERPYKCNICGNRFTTRGNLKVHFQRHKDKYPHIQMNPHPVPEHLDYMLNGNGLPYGMSVPPEKSDEEPAEKKPLLSALSATESLTLLSTGQTLPSFNKFLLMKPGENPAPMKSINAGMKSKVDENTPPTGREASMDNSAGSAGRMQLGKLATSLPSWALLSNHFKANTFPFPYIVDPMGSSETFKLQQLVEKIDKQASSPNQCIICLRVLSCPRALRLHYSQHGGERPFKCKICGRAFSTKGNLKAHFVGHKSSPATKAQNSCPICQRKFTNAVTLQQHIRMHLGGQIPNAVLPEGPVSKLVGLDESFPEQDFSDEDITDEDSLEASGSDNEKVQGPLDSEISSLGEQATTSISMDTTADAGFSRTLPPTLPVRTSPPPYNPPTGQLQEQFNHDLQENIKSDMLPTLTVLSNVQKDESRKENTDEPMDEKKESKSSAVSPEPKSTHSNIIAEDLVQTPEKNSLACYICLAPFPSLDFLEQHIKGHSNDGLSQCPVCKQSFLEKSSLLSHMLKNHPGASEPLPSTPPKSHIVPTPYAPTLSELRTNSQTVITPSPAPMTSVLWPNIQSSGTSSPGQAQSDQWLKPHGVITPQPPIDHWPNSHAVGTSPIAPAPSDQWSKRQTEITPLPALGLSGLWPKSHDVITAMPSQVPSELPPESHSTITPLPPSDLQPKSLVTITPPSSPTINELQPKPEASISPQATAELQPKDEAVNLPHMVTFLQAQNPSGISLSTGTSAKLHSCPVCQKTFSSVSALQIHERVHTEEKPFSCTMCERAFTTQGNLKVHMSTHVWDSSGHARPARPLCLDPPAPPMYLGFQTQAAPNLPAGDDPVQLAKSGPLSFWNQYTAFLARSTDVPAAERSSPAPESPHPPSQLGEASEKILPTPEERSVAMEEK